MADPQGTIGGGLNGWLSKWGATIITGFVVGLVAWGALTKEVASHSERLKQLEADYRRDRETAGQVTERLARIEAHLQFISEQIRQQRDAALPRR